MFYARINKIKVFNNREGFLGLFNRAEMQIYSYVKPFALSTEPARTDGVAISELLSLPDANARRQRLLDAVLVEASLPAQSSYIEVNGVKDNQSLLFGDAGLVIFSSDRIPDGLDMRLWMIESDEDVRNVALDADKVLDSDAFKGLYAAVETALAVTNPLLSGMIAVGGVALNLLRQKLRANKDDLAGYWQATLNRAEHYPHGTRDKQDTYDTTGNILVDYTLFGIDSEVNV
ncbi:MAG: hypothetical protein LBL24_04390 [Bacteroidales bacterium]|jgi:hypothetical protein|nr:hypothetical protein [Bacteroidales bacterium]